MSTEHILKASSTKKVETKKWQNIFNFGNNTSIKILNYTHTQNQKSNTNTDPCWKAENLKNLNETALRIQHALKYLLLVCL